MWYKKHSHLIKHTWCMNSCSVSYFDSTAYHVTFLHVRDESRSISRILFQVYPDTIYRMISKRYGMKIHCMRRYDVCWLWSRWKLEKKHQGTTWPLEALAAYFTVCVVGCMHTSSTRVDAREGNFKNKMNVQFHAIWSKARADLMKGVTAMWLPGYALGKRVSLTR